MPFTRQFQHAFTMFALRQPTDVKFKYNPNSSRVFQPFLQKTRQDEYSEADSNYPTAQ
jgi:hypothetical protein